MTRVMAGLLFGMLLAFSGCEDKNHVPSGVLPHDKMEAVMWDIIQSEQYSSSFLTKDSAHLNLKEENLRLYDQVFRLHQVSREEFEKSYQYYFTRADLAEVLFDSLRAKGERLRTESYSRPSRYLTTPAATPAPVVPPAKQPVTPPPGKPLPGSPLKSSVTTPVKPPAGTPTHPLDTAKLRRLHFLQLKKHTDSLRMKPS